MPGDIATSALARRVNAARILAKLRERPAERAEMSLAVCVGTSGPVDADGVVQQRTGTPGFLGVDLRAALARAFSARVCVENDCDLALIGERWRGCAGTSQDVVCLLAGERLGVGMCTGGTLVRGQANSARDLGFLSLMGDYSRDDGTRDRSGSGERPWSPRWRPPAHRRAPAHRAPSCAR